EERIHFKITDAKSTHYEVLDFIFPRPDSCHPVSPESDALQFNYTTSPFSFSILRTSTREVPFPTASHPIISEPQYLRLKTILPDNANIYGLGENTNSLLQITLTLWSRNSPGIPRGTNLYGNHSIYFEHRTTGTHGVFVLNSNGMDIKPSNGGGNSLEYNAIGGVLDSYFLAGSEPDPTGVARQYAGVAGTPAEVPYWSFGFHQCRFGYKDFVDVAGVISKYAAANIPLETMWTDILDYMDRRRIFTFDRKFIVLMTDPADAFLPDDENYAPYHRGKGLNTYLKADNGSDFIGLVWPGVTVWPAGNTTETLCARWAMLGAFYPFMRNVGPSVFSPPSLCLHSLQHNSDAPISQEFYVWDTVAQAVRNAINTRYRLLDYLYTAFHQAHLDGTPVLHPLWFKYPKDTNTFPIDLQFFFGDSVLVSPVTQENSTSVDVYFPKDIFYDFATPTPVEGTGSTVTLNNINFTTIPLHIKGGAVLPLRVQSTKTTTALRKDFEFVVAPGQDGTASGQLYMDGGESITQRSTTLVKMDLKGAKLDVRGSFGFATGVNVARVRSLNVQSKPMTIGVNGKSVGASDVAYDSSNKILDVTVNLAFRSNFSVGYSYVSIQDSCGGLWDIGYPLLRHL
ncbi:Alpha/beta-glucosidase agdC, partial [Leucoagaricus sp. SymC.cos]